MLVLEGFDGEFEGVVDVGGSEGGKVVLEGAVERGVVGGARPEMVDCFGEDGAGDEEGGGGGGGEGNDRVGRLLGAVLEGRGAERGRCTESEYSTHFKGMLCKTAREVSSALRKVSWICARWTR